MNFQFYISKHLTDKSKVWKRLFQIHYLNQERFVWYKYIEQEATRKKGVCVCVIVNSNVSLYLHK